MKKNEIPDYVSTPWQFVNEEEEALINLKLMRLGQVGWGGDPHRMETRYFWNKPWLQCLLKHSDHMGGYFIVPGSAKKFYKDKVDLVLARRIALSRAVENLVKEIEAAK